MNVLPQHVTEKTKYLKSASHLFTEESRHHDLEYSWDAEKEMPVHGGSLFLAIFLFVLKQ